MDVSTYTLARFVDWLADEEAQGKALGDRTIANATIPLRAALATAKREGLIRHNPAQGLALPPRQELDSDEIKVFTPAQLVTVIKLAPERHRLLLEVLAATGLRISEAIALQRLHVQLEGEPEVCVRRALVRGRTEPPKTKHGRREIRLPDSLAAKLRAHLAARPDQDSTAILFPNESGAPLDPSNLRPRILKPLVRQAGALGRLPHVPPHLRLAASAAWHQPSPTEPRPRPSLARLHPHPLHASVAG